MTPEKFGYIVVFIISSLAFLITAYSFKEFSLSLNDLLTFFFVWLILFFFIGAVLLLSLFIVTYLLKLTNSFLFQVLQKDYIRKK